MGIFNFWQRKEPAPIEQKATTSTMIQLTPGYQGKTNTPVSFRSLCLEGYRGNSACFSTISFLAQSFLEPPMVVVQRKNGIETEIANHPMRQLMKQPNSFMSESLFWRTVCTQMAVGGNSYIYLVRNNAGKVVELYPLSDGQIDPVPGTFQMVDHYLYHVGSETYRIETQDIIQLMWTVDLDQPTRGLSPLVSLITEINVDNESSRFLYSLLRNNAVPGTIIKYKGALTQEAKEALRTTFNDSFGGMNRGSVGVLESVEDVSIDRLSMNIAEMDFQNLLATSETRICAAFGIPIILIGLNTGLQRSVQGAPSELKRQFVENTLVPQWREIGSIFTAHLLPEFDQSPDLAAQFRLTDVQALQEDRNAASARIQAQYQAKILTKNEARQMLGLPAVPGGDVFDGSPSSGGQKASAPTLEFKAKNDAMTRLMSGNMDARTKLEGRFAASIGKALQAAQEKVLAAIDVNSFPKGIENFEIKYGLGDVGWSDIESLVYESLEPYLGEAHNLGIDTVQEALASSIDDAALKREASRWSKRYGAKLAKDLNLTTKRGVREAVSEAIKNGETLEQLKERLTPFFDENRAKLVAQTETTKAYSRGLLRSCKANGIERVRFTTAGDDKVDPDCAAQNGNEFALSSALRRGIPLHPGCRCSYQPVE